jgi:hypothetical protein
MPRAKSQKKDRSEAILGDEFDGVFAIAQSIQLLKQRALIEYQPIVEGIVGSASRDVQWIEHTLDGLLSFGGHAPVLALFKRLCRHYWTIDPEATKDYVDAYLEMWGADDA